MRVVLLTPPFTQINTPYPANAHLTGYLKQKGLAVKQIDLSLRLFKRIFSKDGLAQIFSEVAMRRSQFKGSERDAIDFFIEAQEEYLSVIDPVISFLTGQDDSLALRIVSRHWLPEGPRFLPLQEHPEQLEVFGSLGVRDQAKYLASLMIDDLADLIRVTVDNEFYLSRYGERLAASRSSFGDLQRRLDSPWTLIEKWLDEEVRIILKNEKPDVIGLSCPFPGNVLAALRIGQSIRVNSPDVHIVMGGGYVNTELRQIEDARMFDYVDFLIFDDGERPLELLLEHLQGRRSRSECLRLMWREGAQIFYQAESSEKDVSFKNLPAPDYSDLGAERYVSMMEMPNPMHRLWSDFRWNKMILAHGCYWKACTFCDTSLDYIQRFEPARVDDIVAHMKSLVDSTGIRGFHFVDEAAPPALLKVLSQKLIEARLSYTWWGNLRFDKQFTAEVAQLMAEAGCIAVTGGIEVASPRLLKLINKGVTIEQVSRVTKAFSDAGVLVHAYLMYGFPTQTVQETIDSLEVVRQLFLAGCLKSAHWHRFVATYHSPVGKNPQQFGIQLKEEERPLEGWFARNGVDFIDPSGVDHDRLGEGLRRALYNYMHGLAINEDVRAWFDFEVPKTTVPKRWIRQHLK